MPEEVIELSVDETNKLRAELGLAPLRDSKPVEKVPEATPAAAAAAASSTTTNEGGDKVLELSVDETNDLRAKLGLPPLKTEKSSKVVHKPATNDHDAKIAQEREENSRLREDVIEGAKETFGTTTLGDDTKTSALSWAEQMRQSKQKSTTSSSKASKKGKLSRKTKKASTTATSAIGNYEEDDLQGLHVAHNAAELEAGSTTVLTLADSSILESDKTSKRVVGLNEDEIALENVNLAQDRRQQDGLKRKRQAELGMGHAGGYAGYDDDEFEELGGTLGPARKDRGNAVLNRMELDDDEDTPGGKAKGFRIGGSQKGATGESSMTDFDKMQMGKAISLVSTEATMAPTFGMTNDFMTPEEEEAERAERAERKRKQDSKFKKKKKDKKKKDKKHSRRTRMESDDEGDDDEPLGILHRKDPSPVDANAARNILEQLETTADPASSSLRKRRRDDDDEDDVNTPNKKLTTDDSLKLARTNNGRFEEAMEKGNERSRRVFGDEPVSRPKAQETTAIKKEEQQFNDLEDDDAFLNAALAKARRINRLRAMNETKDDEPPQGAEAIAMAIRERAKKEKEEAESKGAQESGGISFKIDDTREFALALQARVLQKEREAEKAKTRAPAANRTIHKTNKPETTAETVDEDEDDVDMEELALEVQQVDDEDEEENELDGATSRSTGVGRGLSSFVSMLRTTGEISKKNAGREELKGRAKDERNYEDYQPVDLSKVVKIGPNATEKDIEMAKREIKLERRDKDGRLLTTKEAYRDLCYQFHGHGPSKRKEEKRRKQIEREQAQARMASSQVAAARDGTTAGTLGALKATQKATGKAFILHKT